MSTGRLQRDSRELEIAIESIGAIVSQWSLFTIERIGFMVSQWLSKKSYYPSEISQSILCFCHVTIPHALRTYTLRAICIKLLLESTSSLLYLAGADLHNRSASLLTQHALLLVGFFENVVGMLDMSQEAQEWFAED